MHAAEPPNAIILIMHAKCTEELDKRPVTRCSDLYSISSHDSMHSLAESLLHEDEHPHLFNCRPVRRPPLGPEYLSLQSAAGCFIARSLRDGCPRSFQLT